MFVLFFYICNKYRQKKTNKTGTITILQNAALVGTYTSTCVHCIDCITEHFLLVLYKCSKRDNNYMWNQDRP